MEHIPNPFWEDFIEEELIEVKKRRERVILSSLCGGRQHEVYKRMHTT